MSLIAHDDESVSAADNAWILSYGACIIQKQALAAGIGSIPTPLTDVGWDGWFVHGYFNVGGATSGVIDSPLGIERHQVDSKAMRKVGGDEAIIFVIEPTNVLGTEAITFWGAFRMLFKK